MPRLLFPAFDEIIAAVQLNLGSALHSDQKDIYPAGRTGSRSTARSALSSVKWSGDGSGIRDQRDEGSAGTRRSLTDGE